MNSEGNSQNSPFILGLGVPVAGLTVFSCDLEPAANEHKYGCHNEVMSAEKTLLKLKLLTYIKVILFCYFILVLVFVIFSASAPAFTNPRQYLNVFDQHSNLIHSYLKQDYVTGRMTLRPLTERPLLFCYRTT